MSTQSIHKHVLYEASVQDPSIDIDLIERIFRKAGFKSPLHLREDFCGTALLACAWVQSQPKRESWGIDLDKPTLDWARSHRLPVLGEQASRVHLHQENVLKHSCPSVDAVAALNFSYMIFTERSLLKSYFQSVYDGLNDEGVFVLDVFGGPNAQDVMKESKIIPAGTDYEGTPYPEFKYIWDQAKFNAVNQHIRCHIHFKGKSIESIPEAFTYEWRLWSITEITDLLLEVGFDSVDPYFEGWSDEDNDTDGVLRIRKNYEGMMAWISYLAATKRPS
jgi:hypothetical protein